MNEIINKILENKVFYTYSYTRVPLDKKFFTQVVERKLVGTIFLKEELAINYRETNLKDMDLEIIKLNADELYDYMNELNMKNIDGVVFDYPYEWTVLLFK